MNEYTYIGPFRKKKGLPRMTSYGKIEMIRFLWFVIAAAFIANLALLWGSDKSFY
jgi:hypothetical protein